MQAVSLLVALQAVLISTSGVTAAQLRAGHMKVGDLAAHSRLASKDGFDHVADPSGEVVPPASEETAVELTNSTISTPENTTAAAEVADPSGEVVPPASEETAAELTNSTISTQAHTEERGLYKSYTGSCCKADGGKGAYLRLKADQKYCRNSCADNPECFAYDVDPSDERACKLYTEMMTHVKEDDGICYVKQMASPVVGEEIADDHLFVDPLEETPVELTKTLAIPLAIPSLGENSNPPWGFVAKNGSGPCRCQASGIGLDACGDLCCANSPYTATDPNNAWYYGKGGNGDTSNLCWEQPLPKIWAQLCVDCSIGGGFAQCGQYSGNPSCNVTECQSYCEQDASCVSVSYTEERDPGSGAGSECYLNHGDDGATQTAALYWHTYGLQDPPVAAEVPPASEETPVEASPVVAEEVEELAPASEETPVAEVPPASEETPVEAFPVVTEEVEELAPASAETPVEVIYDPHAFPVVAEVPPASEETPVEASPVVTEEVEELAPASEETPVEASPVVAEDVE